MTDLPENTAHLLSRAYLELIGFARSDIESFSSAMKLGDGRVEPEPGTMPTDVHVPVYRSVAIIREIEETLGCKGLRDRARVEHPNMPRWFWDIVNGTREL